MNEIQSALLYQALGYAVSMGLILLALSFLMKGFMWKYLKVRASFGRLVLIKVRSTIRDYFLVGWIEEGFLVFKDKQNKRSYEARISIDTSQKSPFYRSMAILWCDINEEKSAVCNVDYSAVTGYDKKKYSDLMIRCLQQPAQMSNTEKILIGLGIVTALLIIGDIILSFYGYDMLTYIKAELPNVCKNVITGAVK